MPMVIICVISKEPGARLSDLVALVIIVIVAAKEARTALPYLMTFAVIMDDLTEEPFSAVSVFSHQ